MEEINNLPHYYLDIETTGLDENQDEIITIQFQKISHDTGKPLGPLTILTSWEYSEEAIVKELASLMLVENEWEFVPVGNNLTFEFKFLAKKFSKYLTINVNVEHFVTRPHIDIKPIMILANGGRFKGCHLVLGKKENGSNIPVWYSEKNHEKIIKYIENEADCFLQFLSVAQLTLGNMIEGENNFV